MSFAKRKAPVRKGGRSAVGTASSEDADDAENEAAPAIAPQRLKPRSTVAQEEEDANPVFQVRRSKAARELKRAAKTRRSWREEQDNDDAEKVRVDIHTLAPDMDFAVAEAAAMDLDPGFREDTEPGVVDLEVDDGPPVRLGRGPLEEGMVGPGDHYDHDDELDAAKAQQVQDARTARGKGKGKDRMGMRGVISQGEAMRRVCETTYAYDEEESETIEAASVSALASTAPPTRTRVSGGDPVADLERIVKELEEREAAVDEERTAQRKEKARCAEDLAGLDDEEKHLTAQLVAVRELDSFVQDFADMLTAQAPKVTEADETLVGMELAVLEKQAARTKDELEQDLAALGVDDDGARDEFGRSKQFYASARRQRAAEVLAARKARDADEASDASGGDNEERYEFLRAAESQLFGEAHEDFRTLTAAVKPFAVLKGDFRRPYAEAYIPDCLLEALSPFVTYELMWWDPLYLFPETETLVRDSTLEVFSFFPVLCDFTNPQEMKDGTERKDLDDALVPKIVSACVYPRVEKWVPAWNVGDLRQSERLVGVLRECQMYADHTAPESIKALSSLLDAVTRRVLSYTRELIPSEKLAGAPRGPALDCARHGCARRAYAVARTLAMLRGTISDPVLAGLATAVVDRLAPLVATADAGDAALLARVVAAVPRELDVSFDAVAAAAAAAPAAAASVAGELAKRT